MRSTKPSRRPATQPAEALRLVEAMMRDALGLRLLLARLPAGATLDDARRLRESILQRGRQPSRVLGHGGGTERA